MNWIEFSRFLVPIVYPSFLFWVSTVPNFSSGFNRSQIFKAPVKANRNRKISTVQIHTSFGGRSDLVVCRDAGCCVAAQRVLCRYAPR